MTAEPNRLTILPRDLGPLVFVEDIKPLPLIDPTKAAQFLKVARHTLACYRHLGDGPAYYKFGRWIRYARNDLRRWHAGIADREDDFPDSANSEGMHLAPPAIAARFLTVTLSCLHNYRIEGVGPGYLRYSNRIYYPVHELSAWALNRRYPSGSGVQNTRQGTRNHREQLG